MCVSVCVCVPGEVIRYLGVLQQVNQQVDGVFSGQGAVAIHNDVEHHLESLVDVFSIKELKEERV